MKKSFILLFTTIVFIIQSLGQNKVPKFRIEGKVEGFPDHTILYLNDLTDGSYNKIDSTIILKGQFIFSGTLKSKFLFVAITTIDFEDRIKFWLENTTVLFAAEKGNFRNAKITGSKLQDLQVKLYEAIDTAKNSEKVEYNFIKNNPYSILSANTLYSKRFKWRKDTISILYQSLTKEIQSTYYGKNIFDFISFSQQIKIGDNIVDFAQKDTSDKNIKLSDFKGKVILLEFWGSWCESCIENNPAFVKIYNEFNAKGFEIFGVAAETNKQKWVKAIKRDKLPWTNVTDFKGDKNRAAIIYGVKSYPTNYLIDRNGKIIATELYGDDLRNLLLKIL
jgi:peroxiredoxin